LRQSTAGDLFSVAASTDGQEAIAEELGIKSLPSYKRIRDGEPVEPVKDMRKESDCRDPNYRHELLRRAPSVPLDLLGSETELARRYRETLFDH
jgi:hypothetical protein